MRVVLIFPLDECDYRKAFYGNYKLESMLLTVQFFLRDLAYEAAYAERAKFLFWVLFYHPDWVHPRGPHADPVLAAYDDAHEFEDFELKSRGDACVCATLKHAREYPHVLVQSLLALTTSADIATRMAAQAMASYFTVVGNDAAQCTKFDAQATSEAERFIIQNYICGFFLDSTVHLNSREAVQNMLELEKTTYKSPMAGAFGMWGLTKACAEKTPECQDLDAIRQHGQAYLSSYQKKYLERLFPTSAASNASMPNLEAGVGASASWQSQKTGCP